jgi:hypothetical protein
MPFRCYPCPRTPVTPVPRTNTAQKGGKRSLKVQFSKIPLGRRRQSHQQSNGIPELAFGFGQRRAIRCLAGGQPQIVNRLFNIIRVTVMTASSATCCSSRPP